ncbi:MAG: hypothetical protein Q8896_01635 [Bacteroidota bacterium]|nr:hypothetical protein [Bacteroidota bacterium]
MKTFIAMLAIVTVAVCAPSLYSQTYKPDYATKLVLAGGGSSLVNTTTLLAPAGSSFTLTLPGATGSSGYILTTDGAGVMSWTNPATGVVLAGDVTGNAGTNTVAKINGVTLGSTAGTSGNLLIGQGSSWLSTAVTGDVTILNTGVTAIGTNKVTNAQFRQSAGLSVVGNSTNSTGNVADITGTDGQILRVSGTTLGFGTLTTAGIAPGATNTFLTTNGSSTVGWTGLNINSTNLSGNGIGTALNVVTGAITVPSIFSTVGSGNAVGGSYAVSLASEAANTIFAAPDASAGTPTFRAMVTGDIPNGIVTNAKLASSQITFTSTGLTLTAPGAISLGGTANYDLNLTHSNAWGATQTFQTNAAQSDAFVNSINGGGTTLINIAHGGTNSSATPTNGGVAYGTGSAYAFTGAGNAGQVLTSTGAGAPSWADAGASITLGPSTTNNISTATTNNFGPIVANQGIIYLQNSTGASSDLTGIAGGTAGRMIVLVNNSALTADVIVLKDKNASSTSTNQFHLQGGSDIVLGVDGTVTLVYDANATNSVGATGAWRVIAGY